MIHQVVVLHHLVNEAGVPIPVVFRQRVGQRHMPFEIVILGRQGIEFLDVKHFPKTASPIPEGHLPIGMPLLEQLVDVTPQRSHAGAAADIDHLVLRILDEELPERARDGHSVAGFSIENVG